MGKHAYLIMAHNNLYVLKKLLNLLDDERNDIYIHIDKKAKKIDNNELSSCVKKSALYFTERTDTAWGDYSLVNTELLLLKNACDNDKYSYYHLMSGTCLPLKTQSEIHSFFENKTDEFVFSFQNPNEKIVRRVKTYDFLIRLKAYRTNKYVKGFAYALAILQEKIGINRIKKTSFEKILHGWQWFSITDDFARYIISCEDVIGKTYKYTLAPDESFMQTIGWHSPFKDRITSFSRPRDREEASQRYIDFKRGNPYVFRKENFDELVNCGYLFARKFDENIDREIVDMIFEYLDKKKNAVL